MREPDTGDRARTAPDKIGQEQILNKEIIIQVERIKRKNSNIIRVATDSSFRHKHVNGRQDTPKSLSRNCPILLPYRRHGKPHALSQVHQPSCHLRRATYRSSRKRQQVSLWLQGPHDGVITLRRSQRRLHYWTPSNSKRIENFHCSGC